MPTSGPVDIRMGRLLAAFGIIVVWCCLSTTVRSQDDQDLIFDDASAEKAETVHRVNPLSSPHFKESKKRERRAFWPFSQTTDDEDFTEQVASGDDEDVVTHSGEEPHIRTPDSNGAVTPTSHAVIVYFRVTLMITNVHYERQLSDNQSPAFRRLAEDITLEIETIFQAVPGRQIITVVQFSPTSSQRGVLVTFDIGSEGLYEEHKIKSVVKRAIDEEKLGRFTLSPENFSVRVQQIPPPRGCDSQEFLCQSGECIDRRRHCDGHGDCRDGSDEQNCRPTICPSGQFLCDRARCVDDEKKCDRRPDCADGSDEQNCPTPSETCQDDQFRCHTGECILFFKRCDLVVDCPNGEDEEFCQDMMCAPDEFRCDDKSCIDSDKRCDRRFDCPDRSDENNCTGVVCPPGQFKCDDGECISMTRRCDGREDCPDRSGADERGCPPARFCTANQFRCSDGTCVPLQAKCNGRQDCPDSSDERQCPCRPDQFKCQNSFCVDMRRRCDGYNDCQDSSDETNCTTQCQRNEFRCKDGICIPESKKCNRQYDCRDGSDEIDCRSCTQSQFQCRDGSCINLDLRCNKILDCRDGSDEQSCDQGPQPARCKPTDFVCSDGSCVNQTAKCDGKPDCRDGRDETICRRCQPGEYVCNSGHCLDKKRRCDGRSDCPNGEDEADCPERPVCKPGDVVCRDGSCVDASKRCDGVNDCPYGIDEVNCACRANQFRCRDRSCIDKRKHCDGVPDCSDRSDEENCVPLCKPGEITCGDGTCISEQKRCNGVSDCRDGRDESGCACGTNQFHCGHGKCISAAQRCDGRVDCYDYSDENNCACGSSQFRCGNGRCIDIRQRCDRRIDCADYSDELNCTCAFNQFRCGEGRCIDFRKYCDGHVDCYDFSDESNCVCNSSQFRCKNGMCIDLTRRCNGYADCSDYSDEVNCACGSGHFLCKNGKCIIAKQRCDSKNDCGDNSDESNCECAGNAFRCRDGECINARRRCDGRIDCLDFSDESNCACRSNEFRCTDDRCISLDRRCDRINDCRDSSDEVNCHDCRAGQFRCNSGQCIQLYQRCDRRPDCHDGSDEKDCVQCQQNEFQCSDGTCVEAFRHCDGHHDCHDRSDESGCSCHPTQFQCSSGECINSTARCNGYRDCRDGSDESDCRACAPGQYVCANGQCIERHQRCDGRFDCSDYSDESDCTSHENNIKVYPERQTIRQGREVVFRCRDEGSRRSPVKWSRAENRSLPSGSRDIRGRLTIPNIQVEHGGVYICSVVGAHGGVAGAQKAAFLTVQPYVPPTQRPTRPPGVCARSEATCQNGECILREYVCDGDFDCTDRSDELNCGTQVHCEPNELQCGNQKCVLKVWMCDGEDDCGDKTDEKNCVPNSPGSPCRYDEFQCLSGDQCIPRSFQCDDQFDCQDKSDEIGCAAPTITQPPQETLTVAEGETVVITCSAVGNPVPVISWRLNWGHIPSSNRITVQSENGHGMVTIRDARQTDGGAWSCEAINSKDNILATPDCIMIVKPKVGICRAPLFNDKAESPSECLRCFCFGITDNCFSSNLYTSALPLRTEMTMVPLRKDPNGTYVDVVSQYPPNQDAVRFQSEGKEYTVDSQVRQSAPPGIYYYWNLPPEFLGNKLNSYGGFIRYTFRYKVPSIPRPPRIADIIIKGNGFTLNHVLKQPYGPLRDNNVEVRLWEGEWHKNEAQGRGDVPTVDLTTREDIMMVLQKLDSILIRASFDEELIESVLVNFQLDSASLTDRNSAQAVYVEKCSCPQGYTGNSCEDCAVGYSRRKSASYLGECVRVTVPCSCHGHSDLCDPTTGECLNCQHNTEGRQCERCKRGFFGDALQGTPSDCQVCPCPLVTAPNQFSPTCFLERDGQVSCDACPIGYEGRRCERCAPGYEGNPNIPGSQCRVKGGVQCDALGSLTLEPSPTTGLCQCKPYVTGRRCDQCKPNTFFLNSNSPSGCIDCFCMGITKACTSSTWYRDRETLLFTSASVGTGIVITNLQRSVTVDRDLSVDSRTSELLYRNFFNQPQQTYYWQIPAQFLGDKVTSYGGKLNYTVRYEPGRQASPLSDPDAELIGNGIILIYRHPERLKPSLAQHVSIPMFETSWLRSDGQPATREHFLMALADLSALLIKATYSTDTIASSLLEVNLETAVDRPTGGDRAHAVEQCRCPIGYKGLSCEDCDAGYTRSGAGLYLGLCEPCFCNGHSSDCDPETGVCKNCQHNTVGDFCEECAPGYLGSPSAGTPNDCQPVVEQSCNCDPRGSLSQVCDFRKNCRCKTNVQGKNCNYCKEGFFNMDSTNADGCMSCFCFGVTQQCSSSSYYRDQIRMQLQDLQDPYTHSFQLTNRYRSRTIIEGIVVNPRQNEISFASFPREPAQAETLYWSLPAHFLGNKLASYGGQLVYTQYYTTTEDGRLFDDADVEITGNGVTIFFVNTPTLNPQESQTFKIGLKESNWQRVDSRGPTAATRDDLMKVLANVEALLIRASFHSKMQQTLLRNVMLDTAKPQSTGQALAVEVEQCICPPGYIGLSCEECAPGYIRDVTGPGLGRCTRCNCNGHSESCDATTGRCVRCRHNTMGDNCERCVEGYYGDATRGTPEDCKPCPCPLTIPSNQFSPTCYLDSDGLSTCNACPPGYTGRNCEVCTQGYRGNPLHPGGRCEPSGGSSQTIRVRVEELRTQRVPVGVSVTFRCTGLSQVSDVHVTYTLVWTKEGGSFPNRATEASGVLTIPNVRPEDSGIYVCTGSDLHSVAQDRATLIVEGAGRPTSPRVRIEPRYLEVQVGEPVEFQCNAEGFPEPELHWTGGRNNQLNPQSTFVDGIFRIPAARKSDEAEYFCAARNSAGSESVRTVLFVKGEESPDDGDRPQLTISPASYEARRGETVRMECRVMGTPTPTVLWTFSGGAMPEGANQIGGVLTLPRITEAHQGVYVCTASNIHGSSQQQARLLMRGGRDGPVARIEPERQTLTEGKVGELRCIVSGTPTPSISWNRDGEPLSSRHKVEGDTLRIEDVSQSDRGRYTCVAENRDGTAHASSIVEVERREVPAIELYPESNQMIIRGSSAIFQCRVTAGIPTPSVDWTRSDGSPFTSNTEILNGGVIRFNRVTGEEEGSYTCTAENIAGRVTAQARIQIQGAPSVRILQTNPYRVRPGGKVRLECMADGDPRPNLRWYKQDQLLAETRDSLRSRDHDGTVIFEIEQVTLGDSGVYICLAQSNAGASRETIQLIVEDTQTTIPQIVIEDQIVTVAPGDHVQMRCFVIGTTQNIYLKWEREGSRPMPADHRVENGVLYINNVQKQDDGTYSCLGLAEDDVVLLTEKARLAVVDRGPPVSKKEVSSYVGATVELHCPVSGSPVPRIEWSKDGGPLPENCRASHGTVRIHNVRMENAGHYVCTATSHTGRTREFVTLYVKDVPTLEVRIEPSKEIVNMGDSLDLRCRATGDPRAQIQWSKVEHEGVLPDNVRIRGNILTINGVKSENGGVYRCTVESYPGTFSDNYVLAIQVTPQFNPNEVETRTVPIGSTVVMDCTTTLDPPVAYTWSKQSGTLPAEAVTSHDTITITDVKADAAGTYICTAKSATITMDIPTVLIVTGVIPRFTRSKTSYMKMGSLSESYLEFDIEMSFKPEEPNGLLLFNGQVGGGDYIALGLVDGHVEFRFELGSGSAVLRSESPVAMDSWHTVFISRDRKNGNMTVNNEQPVTAIAPGRFVGLDLTGPLFIGGVPNFAEIPKQAGFTHGFTGCIGKLNIKGTDHDLMREAEAHGTTACDACSENPCLHGGICQEALTNTSFTCICPPGFSGPSCEKVGEACYPGVCGEGRCVNRPSGGFDCYCPFGRTGLHCEKEIVIVEPAFSDDAYVAYPAPNALRTMQLNMRVKPRDLRDGLLMYSAQSEDGQGDFTSLAIRNKTIEFRFDTGSGPAILRSPARLQPDAWVAIDAKRDRRDGTLIVNDGEPVVGRSPGHTRGLNLQLPLYIGGVDKQRVTINPAVEVDHGFDGCVAHIEVNSVEIDLVNSVVDSANVEDCGGNDPCERKPCKNGGRCRETGGSNYVCECPEGYKGRNCEKETDLCDIIEPCKNGGTCVGVGDSYKCQCPIGTGGQQCGDVVSFDECANFQGDSYVSLDRELLPHTSISTSEVIRFSFKTFKSDGLLFFHGQQPDKDGKGEDYMSVGISNGYLELSFELGSGSAEIKSLTRVNDGRRHTVTIKRSGQDGRIVLDGRDQQDGVSKGLLTKLNAPGDIYIGGVPNLYFMTAGRYTQGFVGCICDLEIQDSGRIDVYRKAKSGANLLACDELRATGDDFRNLDIENMIQK